MRKREKPSFRYRFLCFLCKVFGLIFVLMLCSTLVFGFLMDRVELSRPEELPKLSQEELDQFLGVSMSYSEETPQIIHTETVDSGDWVGGWNSGIVNILLIGQDRREGEARARSDTMILCTLHPDHRKITMTSFLRDLYVPIPGYQDNRINAAYAAGGAALLQQTIEENFGVHIDGCVEVDFSQFSSLIDLLGGVTMELRQDEADFINANLSGTLLSAGEQLLSGDQALLYARIRKLDADGDFSRTNRQRKILSALLQSCKNASLPAMLELAQQAIPMLSTDMKEGKLLLLAAQIFPGLSKIEIVSQQIPAEGDYRMETIDGMSVLVPDLEAARALLQESLIQSNP